MNCGLGPVDLLRLKIDDFLFDHQHEQADQFGLPPNDRHAYLQVVRLRTGMFCEWMLWDETVDVVRRAIQRSASLNSDYLFVTNNGERLLREGVRNPSSPIQYRYRRLINRVQVDRPTFRPFPFGSLRRSVAEMILPFASSETVGLYLGHSSQSVNNLHSAAPFGLLHRALREVRCQLKSVLTNQNKNGEVT
jgi:integrase